MGSGASRRCPSDERLRSKIMVKLHLAKKGTDMTNEALVRTTFGKLSRGSLIDFQDFKRASSRLGFGRVHHETLLHVFRRFDRDGNNEISLSEFLAFLVTTPAPRRMRASASAPALPRKDSSAPALARKGPRRTVGGDAGRRVRPPPPTRHEIPRPRTAGSRSTYYDAAGVRKARSSARSLENQLERDMAAMLSDLDAGVGVS